MQIKASHSTALLTTFLISAALSVSTRLHAVAQKTRDPTVNDVQQIRRNVLFAQHAFMNLVKPIALGF